MQSSFHDWCIWQIRQRLCSVQGTKQVTVNVSVAGLLGKHPYPTKCFCNSDSVPTTRVLCPGRRRRNRMTLIGHTYIHTHTQLTCQAQTSRGNGTSPNLTNTQTTASALTCVKYTDSTRETEKWPTFVQEYHSYDVTRIHKWQICVKYGFKLEVLTTVTMMHAVCTSCRLLADRNNYIRPHSNA